MALVRVSGFTLSTDGFGAGPDQTLEAPLGVRGEELHRWMLAVSPVFLGRGEHLFDGMDLDALGYRVTRHLPGPEAMHVFLSRS
jgi:hypothetical protein